MNEYIDYDSKVVLVLFCILSLLVFHLLLMDHCQNTVPGWQTFRICIERENLPGLIHQVSHLTVYYTNILTYSTMSSVGQPPPFHLGHRVTQ